MRQENVLDMMRKWRTEQEFREEDIPDHVEAAAGAFSHQKQIPFLVRSFITFAHFLCAESNKPEVNGETSSLANESSSRGSSASKESPKVRNQFIFDE